MNDAEYIDVEKKLKKELKKRQSFNGIDLVNQPPHYQGATLELIDVIKDFWGHDGLILKCQFAILDYVFRLTKKNTVLENAKKIKKYAEIIIESEESKNDN